jgi:tetratricopeptide (TPR) repeat protein
MAREKKRINRKTRSTPVTTHSSFVIRQSSFANWWQPAIVATVALVCYCQTAGYGFVYDDDVQIVLNPRIRSFANVGAAFTENFWAFNSSSSFSNYFRPLQTITYMAGYAVGGLAPSVYHGINIVIHALASLAAFWLGRQLFRTGSIALWGALLFAAHPMHTETVAWIAGLTDAGCGLFYFLSLAAYLRSRHDERGAWNWRLLSLSSFLLALFYKEMALTLPLLIILTDLTIRRKGYGDSVPERFKRWFPYALSLLLYTLLRINALGAFARMGTNLHISLLDRFLTMIYFLGRYLQDLALPLRHNAFHVFRPFSVLGFIEWVLPLSVLAVWAAVFWFLLKRNNGDRRPAFLSLAAVLTLIPVLNLGGIGLNMYAERYLYIPSLYFSLFAAVLVDQHMHNSRRKGLLLGALVLVLASLTIGRNSVWKNNKTLYAATTAVSPEAIPMRVNLGRIYFEEGNITAARREFQAGLDADAQSYVSSPRDRAASLLGLSSVASVEGDIESALKYAEEARAAMPDLSDAYQTLGMLMARKGSYAEAEKLLRRALELQPNNVVARLNIGNIFMLRNELRAAEKEYRAAMEFDPRAAAPRVALALVLAKTNRTSEARSRLHEALNLDPSNAQARKILQQISPEHSPSR